MGRKYFGTDGVRGRVGDPPITPDFVLKLGYCAGLVLARHDGKSPRPQVLIGKDTRISGYMLEAALESGLSAAGVDTILVGPMPTPGVAYLVRALRLNAGIMISASHNPFEDNGIKFFAEGGAKLPDEIEEEIEALLDEPLKVKPSAELGKARRVDDADGRYIEFCKNTIPRHLDLRGMKLVVDCANGAAYHVAPRVFHELGAEVVSIGVNPNGTNINLQYGATHPGTLKEAVIAQHADYGIAVDGDADRCVIVDGAGRVYDGDELLYAIVKDRVTREGIDHAMAGGVVGTLMTNLATERAFDRLRVPFARAKVGDRYVLEMLLEKGWRWGGENSGHVICLDRHVTGDGIITALQVLAAVRVRGVGLGEFIGELKLYPQKLVNVRVTQRFDAGAHPRVREAVAAAERALNSAGRVLLRPSGTEPVIRVMVEGADGALVASLAEDIANQVKAAAPA